MIASNEEILVKAQIAAEKAAKEENDLLGPEQQRGLDCGFAWVVIKPARGKFVNYLKKLNFGETRNYGGGGFQIWYSKLHSIPTQSVSVHQAATREFARVLREYGINAHSGSRLD